MIKENDLGITPVLKDNDVEYNTKLKFETRDGNIYTFYNIFRFRKR